MIPATFYVERRIEEFPGTVTFHLNIEKPPPNPGFQPGQFNMLYAFGDGEAPISLSGAADPSRGYVHTIRALGTVTRALTQLREGDPVGVRGPFGRGWPVHQVAGRSVLIIAGGLGLAPLRPLVYGLLAGQYAATEVRLFYGARQPQEILYADEHDSWSRAMAVQTCVDNASPAWQGNIGAVTSLLTAVELDPANSLAFICGPEIMMRFVIQELINKALPPEAIYLSMERNMQCATGHCGHCQWGPHFICKHGPVLCYRDIQPWFYLREL